MDHTDPHSPIQTVIHILIQTAIQTLIQTGWSTSQLKNRSLNLFNSLFNYLERRAAFVLSLGDFLMNFLILQKTNLLALKLMKLNIQDWEWGWV